MDKQLSDKWDKIYQSDVSPRETASVLADNLFLLPQKGAALDLACGLGANALVLANAENPGNGALAK